MVSNALAANLDKDIEHLGWKIMKVTIKVGKLGQADVERHFQFH
jgi:hypothetical protein